MLLDYDSPTSWPPDVIGFLEANRAHLEDWQKGQRFTTGRQYDLLIWQLSELLRQHEVLAWHCARLTGREAAVIRSGGMELPSVDTLMRRINDAMAEGAFGPAIAEGFSRRHQAGSATRAGRIWFLFTRPCNDDGIEDFLRFWGGESLYAAIDRDPELGPVLRSVGVPSVVEAAIPFVHFQDSLGYETHIARQFCAWREGQSYDGVPHDRALAAIPPDYIRRVVTFHDPDFEGLTGCGHYFEPLMSALPTRSAEQ